MSTVFKARMGRFARVRMDLDQAFDRLISFAQSARLDDIQTAIDTASLRGATMLRDRVRDIYKSGHPTHQKNHPWTVFLKGGDQPLYESGKLSNAVEIKILRKSGNKFEVRVQVQPGENAMKANIAEQGMIIKVTPAMRAYLGSQGINIKKRTQFLMVPARPVFPIAIAETEEQIEAEIRGQLERAFGRIFGGRR